MTLFTVAERCRPWWLYSRRIWWLYGAVYGGGNDAAGSGYMMPFMVAQMPLFLVALWRYLRWQKLPTGREEIRHLQRAPRGL